MFQTFYIEFLLDFERLFVYHLIHVVLDLVVLVRNFHNQNKIFRIRQ